ncbi:helicase-related protein [Streptosporangium sp. NPDC050280]|uniref:helicase-related protein n=1 Tax=unclassified Streptosporangium TaxID=2632669 RepID=UPI003443748E
MADFLGSRAQVLNDLKAELVGPKPLGKALNLSKIIKFASKEEARGPWRDAATGEEILHDFRPLRRYGTAVLAPAGEEEALEDSLPEFGTVSDEVLEPLISDQLVEKSQSDISKIKQELDDDLDLSLANARKQSTIGISVHCQLPDAAKIVVTASFGRYKSFQVDIAGKAVDPWWVRSPVSVRAAFSAKSLAPTGVRRMVYPDEVAVEGADGLEIAVRAYSRRIDGNHLITLTVTNRSSSRGDQTSLFQAEFSAVVEGEGVFLPYPEERGRRDLDTEEQSIALLYRHHQTFAFGHGCAANWAREPGESTTRIDAVCLPTFETPSITPVIRRENGTELAVGMKVLAALERRDEAASQVEEIIWRYEQWITDRRGEVPDQHRLAAESHLCQCEAALARMRRGWELICTDKQIATAFRLANQAMADQQARSSVSPRETLLDGQGFISVEGDPPTGELPPGRGDWRPFQIAFFLAVVESIAFPQSDDRDNVELIFFPTGGGKTEAYLAVAAFAMFLRRLRDPDDVGTEVIMRYTLRLLTAQQFLRAAALICAMEQLRAGRSDLGGEPYTIGIWLGGATTPNRRDKAVEAWKDMAKEPAQAANKFLLLRCPWCAAKLGPTAEQMKARGKRIRHSVIPGYRYRRNPDRITLECPDNRCFFHRGLPLLVVDEDIYKKPPSMVIGTVDKFAMIPWRPLARALFGRDGAGRQVASPPGLIIQDEFHLISGPLGSMVGMYEAVVEDLCTDRRGAVPVKPKIIASTATIRRYTQQVKAVYGRDRVALFPPSGLTAEDSFFAVWARDERTKQLLSGRLYVGVHAPGLGSIQSVQVRTAAALLQSAGYLPDEQKDPWWTSLWFFNSLRELGNTLSLIQADIPDYLVGIRRREGIEQARFPRTTMELTSRRRNDEIPRAIDELAADFATGKAIDICLASNIIEVGVDIDRLSLMAVVGQPKTTSQYIQVTGRVGRRWQERPGLVVTLYGAAKPRDRSHYERFRSYHERLYAQVEPTSVTPFARPVLRRALRGALVAHVRTTGSVDLPSWPLPHDEADVAAGVLLARAELVDPDELDAVEREVTQALQEWDDWDRAEWEANPVTGDPLNGLMRYAGMAESSGKPSWPVPTSMRNVDAECRVAITDAFNTSGKVS